MKKIFVVLSLVCLSSLACLASAVQVVPAESASALTVEIVEPTEAVGVVNSGQWVVCGNVNVRGVPSASGAVLDVKYKDQTVTVMYWVDGWAKIGEGQWVNGRYLCPKLE